MFFKKSLLWVDLIIILQCIIAYAVSVSLLTVWASEIQTCTEFKAVSFYHLPLHLFINTLNLTFIIAVVKLCNDCYWHILLLILS